MLETNIIYNQDCIKGIKDIPDESIDLVVTDPPYLINYATNHRKNKSHDFCNPIEGDNNPELIENILPELYRVMKKDTALYLFCNQDKLDFFKQEVQKHFKIKNTTIWVKNNWTAGDLKAQYGKQYENIIYANKGRRFFNGKRLTDVWNFDRVSGKKQLHQNQKPIDLLEQMIEKSSNPGEICLDPFIGVGSTAVACRNLQRKYIGFEINQEYYDIATKRLKPP